MSIEKIFFSNTLFLIPMLIALVLFDNFISVKSKLSNFSQACIRLIFYFALTILFAYGMFYYRGTKEAGLFIVGYLLEYSLSIDNLFLFLIIIKFFNIKDNANVILNYGIMITVILRLIFISFGAIAIEKFHFTLLIFGIILLIGAIKMLFYEDEKTDETIQNGFLYKTIQYFIPIDNSPSPSTLLVIKNGKLIGTKLLVAMCFIVISDIVCTLDSIPAIFGITTDIFVIYSSNIFAVLGLRSAYIVMIPVIERFKSLEKGIIFILLFIGIKLIISTFYPDLISVKTTLIITGTILMGSLLTCFIKK